MKVFHQAISERMKHKALAKRSQHANATYRNIVGRNMLCAFGHPVTTCCDMLGVVGSSLKMVKSRGGYFPIRGYWGCAAGWVAFSRLD